MGRAYFIKGKIESKRKNHKKALLNFKKAIPSIIDDEYYDFLSITYSNIGFAFDSLNNYKEALSYHLKVDSIYKKNGIRNILMENSYQFLIKDAKINNNLEKQLAYTNNLIEIKEYNLTHKNSVISMFVNKQEIPNLKKEKETLESKIKTQRNYTIFFSGLMIVFLGLFIFQIKKKTLYKKQFKKLMNQKGITQNSNGTAKISLNISEEVITSILKQLHTFENNKDFLKADINLQKLANDFTTNTRYLSKVINQHKETSFSNYINQLRIHYTVEKLKSDSLLRKYTIKAIAHEVGFKNVESFSKAFYKFTKLKPSYFIKELEKQK